MTWVECLGSVEAAAKARADKAKFIPDTHYHDCHNGPENLRPDFHVCACGAVFQQAVDFGASNL